jgi:hypothetical protein
MKQPTIRAQHGFCPPIVQVIRFCQQRGPSRVGVGELADVPDQAGGSLIQVPQDIIDRSHPLDGTEVRTRA